MLRTPWRDFARLLCSPLAARAGSARLFGYLAARTLFYDEVITVAIQQGATQVVIIGAGYDTRALRLASPGVVFYEVDRPSTQRDKQRRLDRAHLPSAILVAADLSTVDLATRLEGRGFDASQPTVFTCEGLAMYLTEADQHHLLATLADLTTDRATLGIDFALDESQSTKPGRQPPAWLVSGTNWLTTAALGEPLRHRPRAAEVEPLLREHHWHSSKLLNVQEICDRYLQGTDLRRPPPGDWMHLAHCIRD
jgi:methyltransferase (TIGR00027 family)